MTSSQDIEIDRDEIAAKFVDGLRRTRLSPRRFAEYLEKHHSLLLRADHIDAVIEGKEVDLDESRIVTALAILDDLPAAPASSTGQPGRSQSAHHIAISEEMRADLNADFQRTGATTSALLRMAPDGLSDLTAVSISRWRTGKLASAPKHHWTFVTELLRSLPDRPHL